jgi:Regulator of chromosome condensation (RCC1) repeat
MTAKLFPAHLSFWMPTGGWTSDRICCGARVCRESSRLRAGSARRPPHATKCGPCTRSVPCTLRSCSPCMRNCTTGGRQAGAIKLWRCFDFDQHLEWLHCTEGIEDCCCRVHIMSIRDWNAGAASRVVLAWGCGSRGQLGSGKAADSAMPRVVEGSLRGRQILQVCMRRAHGPGFHASQFADANIYWRWLLRRHGAAGGLWRAPHAGGVPARGAGRRGSRRRRPPPAGLLVRSWHTFSCPAGQRAGPQNAEPCRVCGADVGQAASDIVAACIAGPSGGRR